MPSLFQDKRTGLWLVAFTDQNRRPRKKKRSTGCRKRTDAEKVYAAWIVAQRAGEFEPWTQRWPGDMGDDGMSKEDAPASAYATLTELRTGFLESRAHRTARTREEYAKVTGWIVNHVGGDRPPESLTTREIERWLDSTNTNATTKHSYTRHIKAMCRWAVKEGILPSDPCSKVRLPRAPKKLPKSLRPEDVEKVARYAEEHAPDGPKRSNAWLCGFIRLGAETAMRRGELLNLRWEHVDLERGRLRVACTETFETKAGRDRIIPLSQRAREILTGLLERPNETGYVFESGGTPIAPNTATNAVRQYADAAGVPAMTVHSLRHSALTWCAEQGVPLPVLQAFAGHSNIATTMLYVSVSGDVVADAVCRALNSMRG